MAMVTPLIHASGLGNLAADPIVRPGVRIEEHPITVLLSLATWPDTRDAFAAATGPVLGCSLPAEIGGSDRTDHALALALARGRWLVECCAMIESDRYRDMVGKGLGTITDLSQSRTAFNVRGADAPELAQKLAPVDFALDAHAPGRVLQSGSAHSIAFTLYRETEESFRFYVERSYAHSFRETLQLESAEFGETAP